MADRALMRWDVTFALPSVYSRWALRYKNALILIGASLKSSRLPSNSNFGRQLVDEYWVNERFCTFALKTHLRAVGALVKVYYCSRCLVGLRWKVVDKPILLLKSHPPQHSTWHIFLPSSLASLQQNSLQTPNKTADQPRNGNDTCFRGRIGTTTI